MTYIHSVILGVIEGITEFLPISSTGHLILASDILKIPQTDFNKSFEIYIQLGAIFAVIVIYWRTFVQDRDYWKKIFIAFLPTGILGLIFYKIVKNYLLGNSFVTLIALFLGGGVLILIEKIVQKDSSGIKNPKTLSLKRAVAIGLFQSISMIPGVSRSAASIIGGLMMGLDRKSAVEFSFLLAIPTMAAATGLDLMKSNFSFTSGEYIQLAVGFTGAFITATIAVKFLLGFVKNHSFVLFGIYRMILALIFWQWWR